MFCTELVFFTYFGLLSCLSDIFRIILISLHMYIINGITLEILDDWLNIQRSFSQPELYQWYDRFFVSLFLAEQSLPLAWVFEIYFSISLFKSEGSLTF